MSFLDKKAGVYYVSCSLVKNVGEYGTDIFVFDGQKYRATFVQLDFPSFIQGQLLIAKVRFFEDGKIDSKGNYEFIKWVDAPK